MNDIKSKLKMLANKQEIHDLSNSIINNVDKSRVIIAPERKRRGLGLYTAFLSVLTASTLVLFVGVLGAVKKGSNNNSSEMDNELNLTAETVNEIYNKEFYNIVNVANSFNEISFATVEFNTENKRMTESEERILVSDINNYIYNIEDMFGLTNPTSSTMINNANSLIEYDKIINVNGPYHSYEMYYSENIISEKNIGKANYKLNANYVGLLCANSYEYEISGNKKIENGKIEFITKINQDEYNYVVVSEIFGSTQNTFRYDYYLNNNNTGRYIIVEQKLNDDGSTREIYIKNGQRLDSSDVNYDSTILTMGDEHYIEGKIKSRDGDYVYIEKDNSNFTYTFKNSKNSYQFTNNY